MAYFSQLKINVKDTLGIGAYGKVVRARLGKRPCAAKLLHDTMFIFDDPGQQSIVRKFKEECELLSSIDHPNIVKYLGTAREPRTGRPVLLMELMHESLTGFLERSAGPLEYYSQFEICHDVALALAYLHSKSVVHRDLSSNNVLLTVDGTAKVTDFGMSRLIAMHSRATPLTQCPGTSVYMPPEALINTPRYFDKLDCFSFGVLAIQIATRQFPAPGESCRYVDDPKYPTGQVIVPIPEIDRRRKHIDLVEPAHPLLPLAIKCIKDRESDRPSALEICEYLAPLRERPEEREGRSKQRKEKDTKTVDDGSTTSLTSYWPFSSKKKPRRFMEDGFDLDLTYIKPKIIAMAFPCEKLESLFRNNIMDVIRLLDVKHPDHYKVYNLCAERSYDPRKFHQRVAIYPFDEDAAPPFEIIKPFCDDVDIWLKRDHRNVAIIHCNDGLGRTGTMVCSYLLHDKLCQTSKEALQFFDEARSHNAKTVVIPSQRRYVQYYGHLVRNFIEYAPRTVLLKTIIFEGIPQFTQSGCSPHFIIRLYKTRIFKSQVYENLKRTDEYAELSLPQPVPLCGDIKMEFYHRRSRMFHLTFNPYFVDMHVMDAQQEAMNVDESKHRRTTDAGSTPFSACRFPGESYPAFPGCKGIVLPKIELDRAIDDSKHFPPNFKVHIVVDPIAPNSISDSNMDSCLSENSDDHDDDDDLSDTDSEDNWFWPSY